MSEPFHDAHLVVSEPCNITDPNEYNHSKIVFERLENNDLPLPTYGSEGAAAFDLVACLTRQCFIPSKAEKSGKVAVSPIKNDSGTLILIIEPGQVVMFSTGFKYEPQENGVYIQLHPRSSSWNKGFMLANTVGIIDHDYRGEIFIALRSLTSEPIIIEHGQAIAQAISHKASRHTIIEGKVGATKRGSGGFGSTDIKNK